MLSIVMPVYNQANCLEWTLESLTRQTTDEFEVVVVDDASTHDLPSVVRRYDERLRLQYLRQATNRGRSAARNAGAAHAQGDRILLMDGDSFASPSMVERHLRAPGHTGPEVVFGRRIEPSWGTMAGILHAPPSEQDHLPMEGDHRDDPQSNRDIFDVYHRTAWMFGYTHNLSLPRQLYQDVGGFDEAFTRWGYEDTDFTYRIFRHFGRDSSHFRYDPAAVCYHMPHFRNWTEEWENTKPVLPYLVDKYRHFDVELFTHPSEHHRRVARTLPFYEDCIESIRKHPWRADGAAVRRVLCPSLDDRGLWIGAGLGPARSFPGRVTTYDHAEPFGPDNPHLLGVRTPLRDGALDYLVNIDLWRMLTPIDLSALVLEALRVSRTAFLVLSKELPRTPGDGIGLIDRPDYFISMVSDRCAASIYHEDEQMCVIRLAELP